MQYRACVLVYDGPAIKFDCYIHQRFGAVLVYFVVDWQAAVGG